MGDYTITSFSDVTYDVRTPVSVCIGTTFVEITIVSTIIFPIGICRTIWVGNTLSFAFLNVISINKLDKILAVVSISTVAIKNGCDIAI